MSTNFKLCLSNVIFHYKITNQLTNSVIQIE